MAEQFSTLQSAMASAEKIFTILDEEPAIVNPERPKYVGDIKGRIVFDHVWFAYQDEDWILKDVSFVIEPGQSVAFVGATGAGKSVCINSVITSLLYKASPEDVKLILIDPKKVELNVYNGIPHLMVPVVTDPRKAAGALGWAVGEMEKRYKMLSDRKVRNIEEYNEVVDGLVDEPEVEKMPYIVIMIDEFADLMQTASKEVEDHIARLAAKARAAGIHMILATQRPSVDVITGVIKANIPTRIALTTSSQIDSRTIIDQAGAEKLLGRGDMLFNPVGTSKPSRLQGCFVSNEEIKAVVDFVKGDRSACYNEDVMNEIERQAAIEKKQRTGVEEDGPDEDPMLKDAIRVVV